MDFKQLHHIAYQNHQLPPSAASELLAALGSDWTVAIYSAHTGARSTVLGILQMLSHLI